MYTKLTLTKFKDSRQIKSTKYKYLNGSRYNKQALTKVI
jgi:hypothetical protein